LEGVLRTVNAFKLGLQIRCGQGHFVKFWKDCWIGDIPLANAFANLFDMASDKDSSVNSQIQNTHFEIRSPWQDSKCSWRYYKYFRRTLFKIPRTNCNGRQALQRCSWWDLNIFYFNPLKPPDKAAKILWKAATPLKVKITTWLVVRDRLPTCTYLHRRQIRPFSHCTFCGSHPESVTHIFLSCTFARRIWEPVLAGLNLPSWPSSMRHVWRLETTIHSWLF